MSALSALRTSTEIVDFILERLGQMSRRPHMYGGNADGVDLCYWDYFELWAFATGNEVRLDQARIKVALDTGCGAMGFAEHFRRNNLSSSDKAVIKFVVRQWLRIAEDVGVPIPWEAIDKDLEELRDYIENWWTTD